MVEQTTVSHLLVVANPSPCSLQILQRMPEELHLGLSAARRAGASPAPAQAGWRNGRRAEAAKAAVRFSIIFVAATPFP